jgi:hypothetical protein
MNTCRSFLISKTDFVHDTQEVLNQSVWNWVLVVPFKRLKNEMKYSVYILLFIAVTITATSCKTDKDTVPDPVDDPAIQKPADVYVGGTIIVGVEKFAVYWKNGVINKIPTSGTDPSVRSITFWNHHLYISGSIVSGGETKATYWIDGKEFFIPGCNSVIEIAVNNSATIILATETYNDAGGNSRRKGFLIKNGVSTRLSPESEFSAFLDLFVNGNDVYVVGWAGNASSRKAVYWKNGILNEIPKPEPTSQDLAYGIVTSGNDVYLSGSVDGKAVYWKNGVRVALSNLVSFGYNICMGGNDLIVSGDIVAPPSNQSACYWKNGNQPVNLGIADTLTLAQRKGLQVFNNHIYMAGNILEPKPGSVSKPVYWKDNKMIKLTVDTSGYTSDIFVSPRN